MSFVPRIAIHPRYISGYGFCMTRRTVLALTGTGTERKKKRARRIKVVLTLNPLDKPLRDYCVGNLTDPQEQSETDPYSFIFVPNRIRSHGKNDCHRGQNESDLVGGLAGRTYPLSSPSPRRRALKSAKDENRAIRQKARNRGAAATKWNAERQTLTAGGSEGCSA